MEMKVASGGPDHTWYRLVAHGQNARGHAQSSTLRSGNRGETEAGAQLLGAQKMRGEIAVPEIEPHGFAVAAQHVQAVEGIALNAPAACVIDQTAQCVGD